MLVSYHFSLRGKYHISTERPCQDCSAAASVSDDWKIAVVADGVGSCKYSEKASEIAVRTVIELIKKQFPDRNADDITYECLILTVMHGAANAIEEYVRQHDPGNEQEYHTTLSIAIISPEKLYFGNAGDSGIVALDTDGNYHILTTKQNDAFGSVYALPRFRLFQTGTAEFLPAAVLCMTDGILDFVVPEQYHDKKFKVHVPLANLFTTFAFGIREAEAKETVRQTSEELQELLQSDQCSAMTDDISVAAVIVTDVPLDAESISWEEPVPDYYMLKWNELSVLTPEARFTEMMNYVRELNPSWSDEAIQDFIEQYTDTKKPDTL